MAGGEPLPVPAQLVAQLDKCKTVRNAAEYYKPRQKTDEVSKDASKRAIVWWNRIDSNSVRRINYKMNGNGANVGSGLSRESSFDSPTRERDVLFPACGMPMLRCRMLHFTTKLKLKQYLFVIVSQNSSCFDTFTPHRISKLLVRNYLLSQLLESKN